MNSVIFQFFPFFNEPIFWRTAIPFKLVNFLGPIGHKDAEHQLKGKQIVNYYIRATEKKKTIAVILPNVDFTTGSTERPR